MTNKDIYIAVVIYETKIFGTRLLRYAFQHPIIEYYGEPEEQEKLKQYFKANHYTHETPIVIEKSELLDFMPYEDEL